MLSSILVAMLHLCCILVTRGEFTCCESLWNKTSAALYINVQLIKMIDTKEHNKRQNVNIRTRNWDTNREG